MTKLRPLQEMSSSFPINALSLDWVISRDHWPRQKQLRPARLKWTSETDSPRSSEVRGRDYTICRGETATAVAIIAPRRQIERGTSEIAKAIFLEERVASASSEFPPPTAARHHRLL
jgi:hypothetical protein